MRPAIPLFLIIYPALTCGAKTEALILARGGSKGVRLKNMQTVGGISLVRRAIITAHGAGLQHVTVSTDHPLIALEAIKSEANVFYRSRITATDWAPSIWGAAEFLNSKPEVDNLVLIQATSPFTRAKYIRDALYKLDQPIAYDCIFSVSRSYKLRWMATTNGPVTSINFSIEARPRRQDWNGEFVETGAFYITRRALIEAGYFQNHNCTVFEIASEDSLEVDTDYDLQLANILLISNLKNKSSAVCRLPPKRVVVGGGSPRFLQRRRAALQRWLTLVARHPVIAHDADLRIFLCETTAKLDKPKHDEFVLAGSQEECEGQNISIDDMQTAFVCEQEQLRLLQLGLGRLFQICERVESRSEAERADIREMGAGLSSLSAPAAADTPRWSHVKDALRAAADLATEMGECSPESDEYTEEGAGGRVELALDALGAHRELCARLQRGLHAERAAAAAAAPHAPSARPLRDRHRYALRCAMQEAKVGRAYALAALESLPELFRRHGTTHARAAALWADLHTALRHPHTGKRAH